MTKRMIRSTLATVCAVVAALAISAVAHVGVAHAATSAVCTASTVPSYSNPVTGAIEDSAGQSNVALAQSMVTGCTYPAAFVEMDTAGNTFVTLRFKLADQMGAMTFWADNAGDGNFAEVEATQMQMTTAGDATVADWRFQVPSAQSNIRVSMYVNPMGRAVIYFVTLSDLVEGNTDAVPFVQTIAPGEEAAASAAETAAAPAASESASSSAAATSAEDSPSTDSAANSGVKEYNADGQETTEGSQSAPLDGATTGAIVAGIVVVVAIAGVVAYFAYLKPKRAKQAAAAAAAASAAKPKGKRR